MRNSKQNYVLNYFDYLNSRYLFNLLESFTYIAINSHRIGLDSELLYENA